MKIDNAVYRTVAVRWDAVTLPLKAGTPMSAAGVPSNDGGAVGIVTQTVTVRPPVDGLPVLVGGDVSRQEAEALYGEAISDDALAAMSGIRFFGEHGDPYQRKGLPAVTAEDNGKVLGVADGAWAPVEAGGGGSGSSDIILMTVDADTGLSSMTWQEVYDAATAGKLVMFVWNPPDTTVTAVTYLSTLTSGEAYAAFFCARLQGQSYDAGFFAGAATDYMALD